MQFGKLTQLEELLALALELALGKHHERPCKLHRKRILCETKLAEFFGGTYNRNQMITHFHKMLARPSWW